ncbi:MAG: ATP-binding cassette domain-containing protein [Actinobacteria bacterium]|nr:ATP-binding cassette domain-containing protein [Actinomycetota bacterium]
MDGLDLSVEEGGVYGFLGPNGSGKTTTIRVILGLHRATAGEVRLMGEPVPAGLAKAMPNVGALVEAPAFHAGISGRRNLMILARVAGASRARVDEVLETVGLSERAGAGGRAHEFRVTVGRRAQAEAALRAAGFKVRREGPDLLVAAGTRDAAKITRTLANRAIYLTGLRPEQASLEAVFLEMTEG